jgi:hypothetical protein
MKTTKITAWALLVLAVFPVALMAQSKERDQLDVSLSIPGQPFRLNMNLKGGSVNISTHEGNDLRITASPEPGINDNPGEGKNQNLNINTNTNVNVNVNSGSVANRTNKGKLLKVAESGNEVVISQLDKNRALKVDLSLPENSIRLNLSLSGKGNVHIADVNGEIVVTSADGPITFKNISGSAMATTVNGNITATFKNVNSKAPMAFSTLIGNIDLSFPAVTKASIALKSDQGIMSSDFNLTALAKAKLTRNNNGGYQAKLAGGLSGNINGGGQEIIITNMQGNIYLRKRR